MKIINYNSFDHFSLVCKAQNKWGIMISLIIIDDSSNCPLVPEIQKAIPILDRTQCFHFLSNCFESTYLLFDTEEGMNDAFSHIVGEDGPTRKNSYKGDKVKVNAVTCNPEGELLGENT